MRNFLLLALTQLAVLVAPAQPNYLSTNLAYGQYQVGFRSILTYDMSRPAVTEQTANEKQGRFMQVNVWYPAKKTKQEPMKYEEYIRLLSFQYTKTAADAKTLSEKQFFLNVAELKGDTLLLRNHFNKLAASNTRSYKDVAIADGRFPLLVFSDYAYNQHIFCEYMASQGYVVVSSPLKGTFANAFDYTVAGIESGVADLQFALSVVRKEFTIHQSFAVMGLGIGATVALALQMRNPDVACVVSLEGGITTGFEFDLIRRSPYFNNERIDKPMLVIHAPHPDVKPELTDSYKYADRWLVQFPQSSEFYFLNYGIWEATMNGILGKAPGDTKTSFEIAASYVLHFLNTVINKKDFSRLQVSESIAIAHYKKAAPIPSSVNELIALIQQKGINAVVKMYHERRANDPEPFSFSSFYRIGEYFIGEKDFTTGAEWTKLFAEAFPSSAVPWFMSGRCLLELNNKTAAKEHYQKALILLERDAILNKSEKDYYRPAIENRLKELDG